jgi:tetratricopeptide (TPR) repeat protein
MPPRVVMPRAMAAALRALEIDDRIAEAQTQVAHIKAFFEWEFAEAESEFRKAMELDPDYPFSYHWCALLLAALGRHDEAVELELRARELEPLSLIINKNVGTILYYAGRHDEALQEYRNALELEPNFARTHLYLGLELAASSEYEEAIVRLEHALALDPGNTVMLAALGYACGMAGEATKAADILRQLEERRRREYVPALNVALVHTGMGERDAAFDWLDAAYDERSSWLISLDVEPLFEPLRPDPRFADLLRRIGLRR